MITQIFSDGITYSNTMFYGGFMTFDEFSKKEVICVKDCRKLGHVVDLEFDECEIEVSDMFCSIYNTCDSYHYVSVNIAECELKD